MPSKPPANKPEWTIRRRIIIATLLWCAIIGTYVIVFGQSDALRQQALFAIAGLSSSVILGYLGFATWDDRNFLVHGRPRGDGDPPDCPPSEPRKDP